jgi:hypothetical protein
MAAIGFGLAFVDGRLHQAPEAGVITAKKR